MGGDNTMIRKNKLRLLLVFISFLSACCSTAKFNNTLTRNELTPQNAIIKVNRSSTWVGGAIPIGIQDALTNIGELGPGGELTWSRSPGYLALVTSIASINTTHVIIFFAEAGKTYSFEMEMFAGGRSKLHPINVSKDKIVYEFFSESYKEPIPDELWKTKFEKLSNSIVITEQNPIEPCLSTEATSPESQNKNQNQKNMRQADNRTIEAVSPQTARLKMDTAKHQVTVNNNFPVDKNHLYDSTDNSVWKESLPDNEILGEKIPSGILIFYTATGQAQKEIVGLKNGIVHGWNACGKPAVWVRDKLFVDGSSRVNRLAVRMAVLRDEAENAGFYYTLTDHWKEIFSRNSYPNSIKKLRIEPGLTNEEALANEKCRQ
jgi:hypothetical protein